MNKTQEIWMQIDGYEDYSVSTCGRVMNNTGKILKPQEDGSGYYQVGLYNDGEGTTCQIHRLVALTFIPNPDNKGLVDHIDRDMNNNNISNLRWATATENNRNASKKSNNTSGTIGVSWYKPHKKWRANIRINKKQMHLGYFDTLSEAKDARTKAVSKYFGEFGHSSHSSH